MLVIRLLHSCTSVTVNKHLGISLHVWPVCTKARDHRALIIVDRMYVFTLLSILLQLIISQSLES